MGKRVHVSLFLPVGGALVFMREKDKWRDGVAMPVTGPGNGWDLLRREKIYLAELLLRRGVAEEAELSGLVSFHWPEMASGVGEARPFAMAATASRDARPI